MRAHLQRLVDDADSTQRKHVAREYLQARILSALQGAGAMASIAFHGGTALRFLYDLDRFSEDLDFSLAYDRRYDLPMWLQKVKQRLTKEGYSPEIRLTDERVVHAAWIRFPGLPHRLGISTQETEILRIKLEVDTRPPVGAEYDITMVRRHAALRIFHHDRPSLLAGKLHAVLHRPFAKGRDFYDLAWYLSDRRWPEPNVILLQNALEQTGWDGETPTKGGWRDLVKQRLAEVDWKRIRADVEPFLESRESLQWVRPATLADLLAG